MDISKLLKEIKNLSKYQSASEYFFNKHEQIEFQFNMSTMLALKKIKCHEISYFNVNGVHGIAIGLLEQMLKQPPSKTWGLLGKELVSILNYWLDGLMKHLIFHNPQWWTFLKTLLKFMKEIRQKDSTLPNILLEEAATTMFDLTVNDKLNVIQRLEVLHVYNICCSESSRAVRSALRVKFQGYFLKLSSRILHCGDFPTQFSILETLMRWLLNRQDIAVRQQASNLWFKAEGYNDAAVSVFMERQWKDFYLDARDFLNALNDSGGLVTSVVIKQLMLGNNIVIPESCTSTDWLDINATSKCISFFIDPKVQEALGLQGENSCKIVVIPENNTVKIVMQRHPNDFHVLIKTETPPQVIASGVLMSGCDVTVVLHSNIDVKKVQKAFKTVFGEKYQEGISKNFNVVHQKRRKHSGVIKRNSDLLISSSVSTSSLAQLQEKLAALPNIEYFDKKTFKVCARPELSSVSEVTECTDRLSLNTGSNIKCGVYKSHRNNTSQSDGEIRPSLSRIASIKNRVCNNIRGITKSDGEVITKSQKRSPAKNDHSCLLVATIGSADDSVINNTIQCLPQGTNDIVDLLVREALQAKEDSLIDSNINANIDNCEVIEDTPFAQDIKVKRKERQKVTSTDESNTEIIDTPQHYVTFRKKNARNDKIEELCNNVEVSSVNQNDLANDIGKNQKFEVKDVDDFFSRHINENQNQELTVSPRLARKINDSSSDSSTSFDKDILSQEVTNSVKGYSRIEFDELEVIECLNNMVDRICDNLEKCTKYLNVGSQKAEMDLKNVIEEISVKNDNTNSKKIVDKAQDTKTKKGLKLTYKNTNKSLKTRKNKGKKAPSKETATQQNETIVKPPENINNTSPELKLTRRKRKLYSPKDDDGQCDKGKGLIPESEDNDTSIYDLKLTKSPKKTKNETKSLATSYKDIEEERKRIRMPRLKRKIISPRDASPRSKKNNMVFDTLKENVENTTEKVILADKASRDINMAVYNNFTSDSEDEDFKIKKIELHKRISSTTLTSTVSAMSRRVLNKINYDDNKKYSDKTNKKTNQKNVKRENIKSKASKVKKNIKKPKLIDERMREVQVDPLNTSFIIKDSDEKIDFIESEPILPRPQMELIEEKFDSASAKTNKTERKKRKKSITTPSNTITANDNGISTVTEGDKTSSPLPGLVVERSKPRRGTNDSPTSNIIQKFQKVFENGPDACIDITDTTQNLLSDIERVNYSPINQIESAICDLTKKIDVSKDNSCENNKNEAASDKTIDTTGRSPITAHGNLNEAPPNQDSLYKKITPRHLEIEDRNKSMKEYFHSMETQINNAQSDKNRPEIILIETPPKTQDVKSKSLDSCSSKVPVVSLVRLSPQHIWLPSRRTTESSCDSIKDIAIQSCKSKEQSPVFVTVPRLSSNEIDKWLSSSKNSTSNRSKKRIKNAKNTEDTQKSPVFGNNNRKSTISPINLDLFKKRHSAISLSDDEDYMNIIKDFRDKALENAEKCKNLRRINNCTASDESTAELNFGNFNKIASNQSLEVISEKSDRRRKKSKSPVVEKEYRSKRYKLRKNTELVSESTTTVSNVNDWLKKNTTDSNTAAEASLTMADGVQNVLEKLETTLEEIHQDSSRKLIHLFADVHEKMEDVKKEHLSLYKDVAKEVMCDVVQIIDNKFTTLNKRSEEIMTNFKDTLKTRASEVIVQDYKKKQLLVSLLKEDLQGMCNRDP